MLDNSEDRKLCCMFMLMHPSGLPLIHWKQKCHNRLSCQITDRLFIIALEIILFGQSCIFFNYSMGETKTNFSRIMDQNRAVHTPSQTVDARHLKALPEKADHHAGKIICELQHTPDTCQSCPRPMQRPAFTWL